MQTGYREGMDEGKELTLQLGFNAGDPSATPGTTQLFIQQHPDRG